MDGGEQLSGPQAKGRKTKRASVTKRMIIMLLAVGLVLGAVFGFQVFKSHMIAQAIAAMANPPQTVSTTVAAQAEWQDRVEAVGSLRAVNGADLSFEVSGVVAEIDVPVGRRGRGRPPLMRLRNEDEVSKLAALQAMADLADTSCSATRQQLRIRGGQPGAGRFRRRQPAQCARPGRQQQAIVDKYTLRAPFAGRLGLRAVDLGQYLTCRHDGRDAAVARPDLCRLLPAAAGAEPDPRRPAGHRAGRHLRGPDLHRRDLRDQPAVDTASRNVQVRATLGNPDHRLMPGMYATASIAAGAAAALRDLAADRDRLQFLRRARLCARAKPRAGGQAGLVARQTFVTTGPTRGDQVAVLRGHRAEGDTVVTAGQIKLRNGSPVVVNNAIQPRNDANPTPSEQ